MMWFAHSIDELYYLIYNLKEGNRYRICGTREMVYGKYADYCSDCDFSHNNYCYRYVKEILA